MSSNILLASSITVSRQITGLAAGSEDTDAVNVAQLKALAGEEIAIVADGSTSTSVKLGDNFTVAGGVASTTNLTSGNIGVVADTANQTLSVQLNKDLNLTSTGSVTIDSTVLNSTGLTVGGNTYVTASGLDANNQTIVNVGNAVNTTDAVNLGQLQSYIPRGTMTANNSLAVGSSSVAAENASAFGTEAVANGTGAVAVGYTATALGQQSVAIGLNATTGWSGDLSSGKRAVAIGVDSVSTGLNAIAIGHAASAKSENAVAVGESAHAVTQATAIGFLANASGRGSVAIGNNALTDIQATAIGYGVVAYQSAIALGDRAGSAAFGIAQGLQATAAHHHGTMSRRRPKKVRIRTIAKLHRYPSVTFTMVAIWLRV